jgi:hypothetical protein
VQRLDPHELCVPCVFPVRLCVCEWAVSGLEGRFMLEDL